MNSMKWLMAGAMLIFGSIGLFARRVPLSSAQISLWRAAVGGLCLLAAAVTVGNGLSWKRIRTNARYLLMAGVFIGMNLILFVEAFRWTSIATGTICYYLAPVFMLCLAPWLLREKLEKRTAVCVLVSLCGLACVAGGSGGAGRNDLLGVACGVGAAVFYACAVMANKFLSGVTPYESTAAELLLAAAFLAPYVLVKGGPPLASLDGMGWLCLAALCLIHTGLAYLMYFTALRRLPAQTTAALSYIDPLSAVLMSWLLLGESMTPLQLAGGALILGATFLNEMKTG
ncbi:DMT family transporter [Pyramidobacter sp. SM-530-WT-4B]|uniref:DMT family transporter n=1 Tax=Pyramidobacter porci TaxID=2605789 RepID=A0A6L5YG41_9BACT|nr:DMT family transporter [Pyramidobacter porci]MST56612.1 DMT family transporter [Pyramidobacter porci]